MIQSASAVKGFTAWSCWCQAFILFFSAVDTFWVWIWVEGTDSFLWVTSELCHCLLNKSQREAKERLVGLVEGLHTRGGALQKQRSPRS